MLFNKTEYDLLHSLVFRPDYPGYKPDVKELPNGDGLVDRKKYAHIALKYLPGFGDATDRMALMQALFMAHGLAEECFDRWGGPQAFRPDIRYGALRILEYAPGDHSHWHTDFDLFTNVCYRSNLKKLKLEAAPEIPAPVLHFDPYIHIGQLGECVGLGPATRHSVEKAVVPHFSAVYFAIPDHDAWLTTHAAVHGGTRDKPVQVTVKAWLNERMARSRTAFKKYG